MLSAKHEHAKVERPGNPGDAPSHIAHNAALSPCSENPQPRPMLMPGAFLPLECSTSDVGCSVFSVLPLFFVSPFEL
jgi:hypothetical protein